MITDETVVKDEVVVSVEGGVAVDPISYVKPFVKLTSSGKYTIGTQQNPKFFEFSDWVNTEPGNFAGKTYTTNVRCLDNFKGLYNIQPKQPDTSQRIPRIIKLNQQFSSLDSATSTISNPEFWRVPLLGDSTHTNCTYLDSYQNGTSSADVINCVVEFANKYYVRSILVLGSNLETQNVVEHGTFQSGTLQITCDTDQFVTLITSVLGDIAQYYDFTNYENLFYSDWIECQITNIDSFKPCDSMNLLYQYFDIPLGASSNNYDISNLLEFVRIEENGFYNTLSDGIELYDDSVTFGLYVKTTNGTNNYITSTVYTEDSGFSLNTSKKTAIFKEFNTYEELASESKINGRNYFVKETSTVYSYSSRFGLSETLSATYVFTSIEKANEWFNLMSNSNWESMLEV